jgi:hypothetical protein
VAVPVGDPVFVQVTVKPSESNDVTLPVWKFAPLNAVRQMNENEPWRK